MGFLLRCEFHLNFSRDGLCNIGLQGQYIAQTSLVTFSPQVRLFSLCVDKLSRDPHARPRAQYGSFDDGVHFQLSRNLPQRLADSPIQHARSTGDDSQLTYLGQGGYERLRHSIGEILLLRVARQVLQRKNCQRAKVRSSAFNLSYKTVTASWKGFNIACGFGAIAQRLS